jgi:hypothetical protein
LARYLKVDTVDVKMMSKSSSTVKGFFVRYVPYLQGKRASTVTEAGIGRRAVQINHLIELESRIKIE